MSVNINLIPEQRRVANLRRQRVKTWACAVAGYAVLLSIIWGTGVLMHQRSGGSDLTARMERLTEETQRMQADLMRDEPKLLDLRVQVLASRAVSQQPDWAILLAALSESRGEQIVLQACNLSPNVPPAAKSNRVAAPIAAPVDNTKRADAQNPDRYDLQVTGMSESQQAVSEFILALERTGLFERVGLVVTERTQYQSQPVVSFTIHCALAG